MHEEWRRNKYGGLFKVTNDYMNKKIREGKQKEISKENIGVHYGDLGKARDTYYWDIESSNRSTGHYGTGTYFYSLEQDENNKALPHFSRGERPRHEVDFSEYKLFKPRNDFEAGMLHDGLKAINYMSNFAEHHSEFDSLQNVLEYQGIPRQASQEAFYKVRDIYYTPKYQNASYDSKLDSLSTIFMKELGYNGIDVRGIDGYDNSTYGSVIYDLNNKRK